MDYTFQELTQEHAMEIADQWKYDGIYSFYDMTADMEDYEEFTNEELRKETDHFEALLDGKLAGFFCVVPIGNDIEIGLGLRPDMCGKGTGRGFLEQILTYVYDKYSFENCILSVAEFNQRAIKVYRSCGFEDGEITLRNTNGGQYAFLTLKKKREKCENKC